MQKQTVLCTTNSAERTREIGSEIGVRLRGGEVVELISDLGGGKTTFTQGLAAGFGSDDAVASPTFTVSRVYKSGKREMHHFDFYRLGESGMVGYELQDLVGDPDVVIVVEWGGVVADVLPSDRLTVHIDKTPEGNRSLRFEYPVELAHLVEGLC